MKPLKIELLLAIFCLFSVYQIKAQPPAGDWGIGIQFGEPSGLTLKKYNPGAMSFDALLAWDLDDFFFINVHGLWHKNLNASPNFNFFYGPGAFVGFIERNRRFDGDDEVRLGISGSFGLNYFVDRFEIYLQVTPRLAVIESTDADVGGGLGVRFYF